MVKRNLTWKNVWLFGGAFSTLNIQHYTELFEKWRSGWSFISQPELICNAGCFFFFVFLLNSLQTFEDFKNDKQALEYQQRIVDILLQVFLHRFLIWSIKEAVPIFNQSINWTLFI